MNTHVHCILEGVLKLCAGEAIWCRTPQTQNLESEPFSPTFMVMGKSSSSSSGMVDRRLSTSD